MTDPISRLNSALEGRYRIERELGEGGMATVYLAEDLKHKRQVALKVLKPELAAMVGGERFLAEIETTAKLKHPHILPLHDSGEADGFLFFVMPHLEGESLQDRIDRDKQLPVDEAVDIAKKVAGALQHAHDNGVVHRDIKPGNILFQDNEPVVTDFGIALAAGVAGGTRLTETGLSVGTPFYMSPEQATGDQDLGPRSDTYSLGCVLYEMLVGDPPYPGSTAQAVLGKIIQGLPVSATAARKSVPANVDAAIRKALERLPADRFTSAQDFGKALADPGFQHGTEVASGAPGMAGIWKPWAIAATAVAVLALGWPVFSIEESQRQPVSFHTRLTDFEVSAGGNNHFTISRDGSLIAANSQTQGPNIFIRRTSELEFREIPGTENVLFPTFSPDGQWLAFSRGQEVMRVQTSGGPVLPVTSGGSQPHWGADDLIVINCRPVLCVIPPTGGEPRAILGEEDALNPSRPFLLPDGEAVVFEAGPDVQPSTLMLVEIESGSVTDLGIIGQDPQYIPTGHLIFGHLDQALMAVRFDLESHEVMGEPFTVLPGVAVYQTGATQFQVSDTGTALYAVTSAGVAAGFQLVEVDPDGVETPLPLGDGAFLRPRYSPSGRHIAYELDAAIWIYDRETGANDRLSPGDGRYPVWSSDGRYVYYASGPAGPERDGYRRLADLSEDEEPVYSVETGRLYPASMSPSGDQILMIERGQGRGADISIMSPGQSDMALTSLLRADWNEAGAVISPGGRWIAYDSDETGTIEVYVRSFPDATNQIRISVDGGAEPLWSPDGMDIYYRSGDRRSVIRAPVQSEDPLVVGEPQPFLAGDWEPGLSFSRNWDQHPDGDLFLFVRGPSLGLGPNPEGPGLPIRVVVNWFEELSQVTPD